MENHSVYIHIPFCKTRCGYCDFNTYAGQEGIISVYVTALCREIELVGQETNGRIPVHTIFFGGGTPSLLPEKDVEKILDTVAKAFEIQPFSEISLEANPGTVSLEYLSHLKQLGINRLSMGMQSDHSDDLSLLERRHKPEDVVNAVTWARQAGFHQINLDLIFGIPHQTIDRWKNTLEAALRMEADHLSLYALTVEKGTPLAHWVERGTVPMPDDDLAADMYEYAGKRLREVGFFQYEISNWSRKDPQGNLLACQHNLQYWRGLPYLGFGAGAHGFAAGIRTADVLAIQDYIQRMESAERQDFPLSPANATSIKIDQWTAMQETMMVGLRLTDEGVSAPEFQLRFGRTVEGVFGPKIDRLIRIGLMERHGESGEKLRLTERGRLLGNRVFMEFVGNPPDNN